MSKDKNKIAVYTTIIDGYDNLIDNQLKLSNVDYICFTDDLTLKSNLWKIKVVTRSYDNPTLDCRKIKIKYHEFISSEYDYNVWIDGNFRVKRDFSNLTLGMKSGILTFDHSKNRWDPRNCIYDEFNACRQFGKDDIDTMGSQIEKYKKDGYPKNNGLVSTGVLIRKNNDKPTQNFMNKWFDEIENHSIRDQLSFNYVSWKYGFNYDTINSDIRNNKYFKMNGSHKK